MSSIVNVLKSNYTKPSPHRDARLATVLPLAQRARDLRDEHASILRDAGDLAHDVASLNLTALALYLRPDVMPLVQKAHAAAKEIASAGTPDDAMAAVRVSEHGIDSHNDSEFSYRFNDTKRQVDLLAGAVASLKKASDALVASLGQLDAAAPLTSGLVTVPPRDPQPAISAA